MSERSDFLKFLRKIGGRPAEEHDTKREVWLIGSRKLGIPHNLSGTRTLRNYRAEARRIARTEKLLPERFKKSSALTKRRSRRGKSLPDNHAVAAAEEATPEEVARWQAQKCLEEIERKRRFLEGARMAEEGKARVSRDERAKSCVYAIRERGSMTAKEVCAHWGWSTTEHDLWATGRVLRDRTDLFRQVDSKKRRGRFGLAPVSVGSGRAAAPEAEKATTPAAALSAPSPPLELTSTAKSPAPPEVALSDVRAELESYRQLFEEIRKVVGDFRGSDLNRACFVLGQVDGLMQGRLKMEDK